VSWPTCPEGLLYQLGMMTPLIRTGRAFFEEFQKYALDKLRELLNEQPEPARLRGDINSDVVNGGNRTRTLRRKETIEMQEL
jgi:hypothetical protein